MAIITVPSFEEALEYLTLLNKYNIYNEVLNITELTEFEYLICGTQKTISKSVVEFMTDSGYANIVFWNKEEDYLAKLITETKLEFINGNQKNNNESIHAVQ